MQGGAHPVTTVPVDDAERRRFCLTDEQIEGLARQAMHIEQHYGRPMISSGHWTASMVSCTSCRRARRRCRAAPAT